MSILDLLSENPPQLALEYKGQKVFVRHMTPEEEVLWDAWVEASPKDMPNRKFMAELVTRMACDEAGERCFRDDQADKVLAIPAPRRNKIAELAWKMHRGEVDEAKKDSALEGAGAN